MIVLIGFQILKKNIFANKSPLRLYFFQIMNIFKIPYIIPHIDKCPSS